MQIRPAVLTDAEAITAIYNHAVTTTTASFDIEPKGVEHRRAWLAARAERHPVLVAVDGDEVTGWGAFSAYSDRPAYDATAEISVYVHPNRLRGGIGRALSVALLERAPHCGLHTVIARICSENTGSVAMVAGLGFNYAGTMHEVGYKFGRWLDVETWEYGVTAARE